MKRFLMFSVSVLCLAVTVLIGFYVGSQRVEAQAPADVQYSVYEYNAHQITSITPNGDVYNRSFLHDAWNTELVYIGNMWEGVISTDQSTWGDVKQR